MPLSFVWLTGHRPIYSVATYNFLIHVIHVKLGSKDPFMPLDSSEGLGIPWKGFAMGGLFSIDGFFNVPLNTQDMTWIIVVMYCCRLILAACTAFKFHFIDPLERFAYGWSIFNRLFLQCTLKHTRHDLDYSGNVLLQAHPGCLYSF